MSTSSFQPQTTPEIGLLKGLGLWPPNSMNPNMQLIQHFNKKALRRLLSDALSTRYFQGWAENVNLKPGSSLASPEEFRLTSNPLGDPFRCYCTRPGRTRSKSSTMWTPTWSASSGISSLILTDSLASLTRCQLTRLLSSALDELCLTGSCRDWSVRQLSIFASHQRLMRWFPEELDVTRPVRTLSSTQTSTQTWPDESPIDWIGLTYAAPPTIDFSPPASRESKVDYSCTWIRHMIRPLDTMGLRRGNCHLAGKTINDWPSSAPKLTRLEEDLFRQILRLTACAIYMEGTREMMVRLDSLSPPARSTIPSAVLQNYEKRKTNSSLVTTSWPPTLASKEGDERK